MQHCHIRENKVPYIYQHHDIFAYFKVAVRLDRLELAALNIPVVVKY